LKKSYIVVSSRLEIDEGAEVITAGRGESNIKPGSFCVVKLGSIITYGRFFPSLAGSDWLVQPGRMVRIVGKAVIEILALAIMISP